MAAKQGGTSFSEIMGELKNKIYRPVYFLSGDEPYYIDKIAEHIEKQILTSAEKAFNLGVYYGKDITVGNLITAARRFPMMGNHLVIVVKEAQNVKDLNKLEIYVKNPQPSTVLAICHKGKIDKKEKGTRLTALIKEVKQKGVYFESNKLYDNQIPTWIQDYLKARHLSIDAVAARLLVENLGNDLNKIANELEKLIITLPAGTKSINTTHIEQNIGISKDFNQFELTKAISERDITRCNLIADHFARNIRAFPNELTLSKIHQHFVRILKVHLMSKASDDEIARQLGFHPFFMREYRLAARHYSPNKIARIFTLIREYDLRSKGVNNNSTNQGELLRELLFFILH